MKLSAVSQLYQAPCFPNVRAIATVDAEEDLDQNVTALERSAKACVEPAIKWFLRKFNVDPYPTFITAALFFRQSASTIGITTPPNTEI